MIKSSHPLIHEEAGHHGHPPSASIATWSVDDVTTASLDWVKPDTHQTNVKEPWNGGVGSRRFCLDKNLALEHTAKTTAYGYCACMIITEIITVSTTADDNSLYSSFKKENVN